MNTTDFDDDEFEGEEDRGLATPSVMPAPGHVSLSIERRKSRRTLASRNLRALNKEFETHGFYVDGGGKRYRVGVYYVLAGEIQKAVDYYDWFAKTFPDDSGEPVADLYWALALYRHGDREGAKQRLLHAMLQNVYFIPYLCHEPVGLHDVWHGSNWKEPGYLRQIDLEELTEPTPEEREWMKAAYYSDTFTALRNAYLDTYHALSGERNFLNRTLILDKWRQTAAKFGVQN